jgi:hypothetical protein
MQVNYPMKVQAIRTQGRPVRLYVALPLALAAAIGLEPGETVQWNLLTRRELHLLRQPTPPSRSNTKPKRKR